MAQDSGSSNLAKVQDVDLDDIEINILVICKSSKNMSQSTSFLTRRGWPTTTLTNVSKAVEYVAEHRPDFVLMSFTHPSPAMLKLPDLITQTFNLICVGMYETNDSQSVAKLKESKMRHKVQGAPSGPNLQRVIRRILADKLNAAAESNARAKSEDGSSANEAPKDDVVTIKGNDNVVTVRGSVVNPRSSSEHSSVSGESNDEQVAHISGQLGTDFNAEMSSGEESVSTGTYTMSKANRRSLKSLLNNDDTAPKADVLMAKLKESLFGDQPSDADVPDDDDIAIASIAAAKELEASGELEPNDNHKPNVRAASAPGVNAKSSSLADKLSAAQGLSSGSPSNSASLTTGQGLSSGQAMGQGGFSSGQSVATNPKSESVRPASNELDAVGAEVDTAEPNLSPEQMLRRAVESTLRRVCNPKIGTRPKPLSPVEKVAVFSIDSTTVSGYLVIAVEHDPNKIEDFFLKACENALREEFNNLQVPAVLENGFWVHIPAVEFVAWAKAKAEFHVTMAHETSQAAMAFFPMGKPPRAQLANNEQQMFSISIDDISTDHPINFKAYLHLKINDKYFLYLRNGRQLQPEQKSRLKDRKVDNIFMKSVDVENLNMFLAASFLRNSIKAAG